MYETLPGSLGPQTPWKTGATGLQSSDFGWNLQLKHHHHFIDGLVGLRMTYVGYFDIWPKVLILDEISNQSINIIS